MPVTAGSDSEFIAKNAVHNCVGTPFSTATRVGVLFLPLNSGLPTPEFSSSWVRILLGKRIRRLVSASIAKRFYNSGPDPLGSIVTVRKLRWTGTRPGGKHDHRVASWSTNRRRGGYNYGKHPENELSSTNRRLLKSWGGMTGVHYPSKSCNRKPNRAIVLPLSRECNLR